MEVGGQERIPAVFCWTKMGTEAGQPLEIILRRKELERQAGAGVFTWGIGNSLGSATEVAKTKAGSKSLDVLFTKMLSSPKASDVTPSSLMLWLSYLSPSGSTAKLPAYSLVTSRGEVGEGQAKRNHYALICTSRAELTHDASEVLDAACVRNIQSLNPVGASQVTAVVQYDSRFREKQPRLYEVAFKAKLIDPGFVKLTHPILMTKSLLSLYAELCVARSTAEWIDGVTELKRKAIEKMEPNRAHRRPQPELAL